jgi:hypothetical protein
MFLGFKTNSATLGVVTLACRNGHTAAHRLVRSTRQFILFFLPLFPEGKRYFTVCTMCGQQVAWRKEEAEAMAARSGFAGLGAPAGSGTTAPFDPVSAPVDPLQTPYGVSTPPVSGPPAGWYPDPSGQPRQRWWDGRGWTELIQEPASRPEDRPRA